MSAFSGSPRLQKGALVVLDPATPPASVIVFQYNPDTLTRSLAAQTAGGTDRNETLRLKGPPEEKISLEVEIDATDQLEQARPPATQMGINPILAALELCIYPKSSIVRANDALLAAGVVEVVPPESPLTILIWGPKRVLPVRLTQFTITEEAFDADLNPIRAKVRFELTVLNYDALGLASAGGNLFMAHQVAKEGMATLAASGQAAAGMSAALAAVPGLGG